MGLPVDFTYLLFWPWVAWESGNTGAYILMAVIIPLRASIRQTGFRAQPGNLAGHSPATAPRASSPVPKAADSSNGPTIPFPHPSHRLRSVLPLILIPYDKRRVSCSDPFTGTHACIHLPPSPISCQTPRHSPLSLRDPRHGFGLPYSWA
jgi:hypothetical protein